MPVLEQSYGATIEGHDIHLERRDGAFVATYKGEANPISPSSISSLLAAAAGAAQSTALTNLAAELGALSSSREREDITESTRHDVRVQLADELAGDLRVR